MVGEATARVQTSGGTNRMNDCCHQRLRILLTRCEKKIMNNVSTLYMYHVMYILGIIYSIETRISYYVHQVMCIIFEQELSIFQMDEPEYI